ncbi:MAG: Nif11-like leader peptide family natural product precursor [Cyanobacteriota bacterium]|nr:Nif11-like leader peptide family natural product precursor [Cyanobacteriota bacterium]
MTDAGLRGLLAKAFEDPELEARLKAPGADVVGLAAAAGFSITAEEFSNALKSWENWRISAMHDDEV